MQSISFGGGEPLEYPGIFDLLETIEPSVGRSLTTNGVLLDQDDTLFNQLTSCRPDKVHVSIHFPERAAEVERAVRLVNQFEAAGVAGGVNLLVRSDGIRAARRARIALSEAGIGPAQLVILPMKGINSPSLDELAQVAGSGTFQSVTCLLECAASPRFASIGWDKRVGGGVASGRLRLADNSAAWVWSGDDP